jgi:hypothetical protein
MPGRSPESEVGRLAAEAAGVTAAQASQGQARLLALRLPWPGPHVGKQGLQPSGGPRSASCTSAAPPA